jgi:hypothetical protein
MSQINGVNQKNSYNNAMIDNILSQHLNNYSGMEQKSEVVEHRREEPRPSITREELIRQKMMELKELGINTDSIRDRHGNNFII